MIFDQPKMNIGEEVMDIEEWNAYVECGLFIPNDGSGHWGTETHYTYEGSVWRDAPEGATHVHWYNK